MHDEVVFEVLANILADFINTTDFPAEYIFNK